MSKASLLLRGEAEAGFVGFMVDAGDIGEEREGDMRLDLEFVPPLIV